MPAKLPKPINRQELGIERIASVTQLSASDVSSILMQTAKVISYQLKENLSVVLDFNLTNNEVILF
jgi:hypothetical protein